MVLRDVLAVRADDFAVMDTFKFAGTIMRSSEGGELRRYLHQKLLPFHKDRLEFFLDRIANRAPDKDRAGHEPRRGRDCGLRMQDDKIEVLMLGQEPARTILQNIPPPDPRHAQLACLFGPR